MDIQLPTEVKAKVPSAKIPVQYEEACKALVACTAIDEAKFWDNKADALAAWARIYKSDQAAIESKRLKLHAYRRMGELSAEIAKTEKTQPRRGRGQQPGAHKILMREGLNHGAACAARRLARMTASSFDALVNSKKPPAPYTVAIQRVGSTDAWNSFNTHGGSATAFRTWCRRNNPSELARAMKADEARKAREVAQELSDWLDEFEQHLPKSN